MGTDEENGGWYRGWSHWDGENVGAGAMLHSLLAEAAGAGTVAADATMAEWFGGGYRRHIDGRADGRSFDVKRAWEHAPGVVGFGGPGRRGSFDPAAVTDVVLLVTDTADLSSMVTYEEDGTVQLTGRLRPSAVYVVPAANMNQLMRRDGKSQSRWLVERSSLAPFTRRSRVSEPAATADD